MIDDIRNVDEAILDLKNRFDDNGLTTADLEEILVDISTAQQHLRSLERRVAASHADHLAQDVLEAGQKAYEEEAARVAAEEERRAEAEARAAEEEHN